MRLDEKDLETLRTVVMALLGFRAGFLGLSAAAIFLATGGANEWAIFGTAGLCYLVALVGVVRRARWGAWLTSVVGLADVGFQVADAAYGGSVGLSGATIGLVLLAGGIVLSATDRWTKSKAAGQTD